MTRIPIFVLAAALPLFGMDMMACNGDGDDTDAGESQSDAGPGSDAASGSDAATGNDAASGSDAAMPDAAESDSAMPDSAEADGAMPDAAMPDTAMPDAAMPDAAPPINPPPGTWSVQALSPYSGNYQESSASVPHASINASGDAVVVWRQNQFPFYAERTGGVWTLPADVNDHIDVAAGGNGDTMAGIADNGDVAFTWSVNIGGAMVMMSTRTGGVWTHPVDTSDRVDYDSGLGSNGRLKMSGDGSGILAWKFINNGVVSSIGSGAAWAHPGDPVQDYLLNVGGAFPSANSSGRIDVGVGNGGNAVVAWSHEGNVMHMAHKTGTWALGTQISPVASSFSLQRPTVAVGNNGDALVGWFQDASWTGCDNACGALFVSEYTDGAWTHPASADDYFGINDEGTGSFYDGPFMAIADNGDAIVAWRKNDPTNQLAHIYVAERTGGVWSKPAADEYLTLPGEAQGSRSFAAAMGGNGDVVMVRAGQTDAPPSTHLYAIHRVNGQWYVPVSKSELIMMGQGGANDPHVAVSANGQAIIAAVNYDETAGNQRVWIAEYTPN